MWDSKYTPYCLGIIMAPWVYPNEACTTRGCSIWTISTHSGSLRNYTIGVIQDTLLECKMRLHNNMEWKENGSFVPNTFLRSISCY